MATTRARKIAPDTDVATASVPREGRAHSASYTKIKGELFKWFIRVVGPKAELFAGRDIPVTTKSGEEHSEKLTKMVWNGQDRQTEENVAIYEFLAKPRAADEELSDEIPF